MIVSVENAVIPGYLYKTDTCQSFSTGTAVLSYNTCSHLKSSAYNKCNNKTGYT